MLLRLCQLKSLFLSIAVLTVLTSCAFFRDDKPSTSELRQKYGNNWFKVNPEHSLVEQDGEVSPHLFFDTPLELNEEKRTVNVIITIPAGSQHAYTLDLNSGQRHYSHTYCKQKDVWNKFGGTIDRPFFSVGHLPKVLDQLGEPQKIIIWSRRKDYPANIATNYHRVKLIGAYVEQLCAEGNCLGRGNWLSRMVFIGIDAEDKSLEEVSQIDDFQKNFDWDSAKAYLENIEGRNTIGEQSFPYIRVSKLISFEDAFDYFKKRSIIMSSREAKRIQRGCHSLYEKLWEDVGKWRPEDMAANTVKELNAKIKLREQLKEKKLPVGFAQRMRKFTQTYFNEITTCEKFVYHGNINRDREKFWFLSHMSLFYRLHREGYAFECRTNTWQRNVLNEKGEPVHDLKRDIMMCNEANIDRAMEYLPNFLKSLKDGKDYYRFIDYDQHAFGTHEKMYSWVKIRSKRLECSNDPNQQITREMRVYPDDVRWKERNIKDIADRMKIIY